MRLRPLGLLLFLLPVLLHAAPTPSLPAPTGTQAIGKALLTAKGESILLWYPAQRNGRPAAYAPKSLLTDMAKSGYYDQSAETIQSWSTVQTHSSEEATSIAKRRPLVIFLPGAGVCGFQYTAFAEELASHGYIVAVLDYFSPHAPKRPYDGSDSPAMENDMARAAVDTLNALADNANWHQRIRFDRVGVAGHSIGGAAAIAAARADRRFRASLDMDGAPFGDSLKGAVAPLLVLRSKPIYSDAELANRGRTREQWEKLGLQARRTWTELQAKSGTVPVTVWSVKATGHFSFSDAPFVMPDTITRFGGNITSPERAQQVITNCLLGFFDRYLEYRASHDAAPCSSFEEIVPGIPLESPTHR